MSRSKDRQRPMLLLLAAGRARRFGRDKRQELLCKGQTLLEASVQSCARTGLEVLVCLSARPDDDELAALLPGLGCASIRCSNSGKGMGATLAQAVAAVPSGIPAVFVALADMPLVRSDTLEALEAEQRRDRIVFPSFQGRQGHPVLFGSDYFSELATLGGDRGARSLFQRYPDACREIPVSDPGVLLDMDTPDDHPQLAAHYRALYDSGASG